VTIEDSGAVVFTGIPAFEIPLCDELLAFVHYILKLKV